MPVTVSISRAVQADESSSAHARGDLVVAESERPQLPHAHHAVLARREARDDRIRRGWQANLVHMTGFADHVAHHTHDDGPNATRGAQIATKASRRRRALEPRAPPARAVDPQQHHEA